MIKRALSLIVLMAFLAQEATWAVPDVLQIQLRGWNDAFKPAFYLRCLSEKAGRIAALVDENRPSSLSDIALPEDAELTDVEVIPVHSGGQLSEVLITINGGEAVMRYAADDGPSSLKNYVTIAGLDLSKTYDSRRLYRRLLVRSDIRARCAPGASAPAPRRRGSAASRDSIERTVINQVVHLWFDAEGNPVVNIDTASLQGQGARQREAHALGSLLRKAVLGGYAYLAPDEKAALFQTQKGSRVQQRPGVWIELPLSIRIEQGLEEAAIVTPHEIILDWRLLAAPEEVLALILSHGFRRSAYRFEPDRQPHDSAVFQKTLQLVAGRHDLYEAWQRWEEKTGIGKIYGRDWEASLRHARELTSLDEAWRNILPVTLKRVCQQSIQSRPQDRTRRAASLLASDLPGGRLPAPSHVYVESYNNRHGMSVTHLYIVYALGDGIRKVVRIAPRDTKDWLATNDASEERFIGNWRIGIVRDPQTSAADIVSEREMFERYPELVTQISALTGTAVPERDAAVRMLQGWARDKRRDEPDLARASSDILFSFAKTCPDRAMRIALNRFVFDDRTERPVSFPPSTFNYSAFTVDGYTVRVPLDSSTARVRVAWSVNGSPVRESAELVPVAREEGQAWYAWEVPVTDGWVHYAFQVQDANDGAYHYIDSPRDSRDVRARRNGIIKFQEDVRGQRVLGIRPEVFNLRLDAMGPLVDRFGNVQTGTLADLAGQLRSIKEQGFDEIYLQALETGAPGEAGPDASPFAPIDQIHISHRIGGMAGLMEVKRLADEIGLGIALDMIPHSSRSNREASPRTPVWIIDGERWSLVRRAASDGGLSPEWFDGFARNWGDPRNVQDYLDQIRDLARRGFDFRIDVGHVFDTTFETDPDTVGMAKVQGQVVTAKGTETLDLRNTEEPNTVLAWIIYQAKKAALESGRHPKFYAENWHGHEARLIQAGVDFPFNPMVAVFWNVLKSNRSTNEIVDTSRWLSDVTERFGGGTVTAINTHDSHVPPVDAFGSAAFVATAAMVFLQDGALFQHIHYSYRKDDGSIDWERALAEVWMIYVNNYGPARVSQGTFWPGVNLADKIAATEAVLASNQYFKDIGRHLGRLHELVTSVARARPPTAPCDFYPIALDAGHNRVAAIARRFGDETLIGFFHQGSPYAADINFCPDDAHQYGRGLGTYEADAVYVFEEVFDNEDPSVDRDHPGDRILLTGREITNLGMGPRFPLPILGIKVYRSAKISDRLPAPADNNSYRALIEDSLLRYKRYGPKDRFEHSFVAREIRRCIEGGDFESFVTFFKTISAIIESNPEVDAGELGKVFGDFVVYCPQYKARLHEYLIDIAVVSQDASPLASETAVKVLKSADIGEIVLTSPECIWSSGSGGLALYVSSLASELTNMGLPVTVILPLFDDEKEGVFKKYQPRDTGRTVTVTFGQYGEEAAVAKIYESRIHGARVLYLENQRYFPRLKGSGDGGESAYNGTSAFRLRFARMLSLGTLLTIREMNIHASVIQTNEWGTAYVKAYLEGRNRIDRQGPALRSDPHLAETRVVSTLHNLHNDYQGRVTESNRDGRDAMMRNDLGFDPALDWDVLVRDGDFDVINPTYTAIKTADCAVTVSRGYHARSLDAWYDGEFGGLTGLLRWKNGVGGYIGIPNGFDLVARQRNLLAKSLFEVGHEVERRAIAESFFADTAPAMKRELQRQFGLAVDTGEHEHFLYTMFHRTGSQKGHQLLLADIWRRSDPAVLRSPAAFFEKTDEIVVSLHADDRDRLAAYAAAHGRESLRAAEVAMVLIPELQMVIAGSVESDFYYHGFREIAANFPEQFRFHPEFIRMNDARYDLIYAGSTVFGMPSLFEPCGLSNQEAAGFGVIRHTTRRDGLVDGEIRGEGFAEGFDSFNPADWFRSLRTEYTFFKERRGEWNEFRYKAITQDNRWLSSAKVYVETYRLLAGAASLVELDTLEVAAAIHRSEMLGARDAADELMKVGFTPAEAVRLSVESLRLSANERLVTALVTAHIPSLNKIDAETSAGLRARLEEALAGPLPENVRGRLVRVFGELGWAAPPRKTAVTVDDAIAGIEAVGNAVHAEMPEKVRDDLTQVREAMPKDALSPRALVLYADSMLTSDALLPIDDTGPAIIADLGDVLQMGDMLANTTIIVYARKEGNARLVKEILTRIAAKAGRDLAVVIMTGETDALDTPADIDEAREFSDCMRRVRRSVLNDIGVTNESLIGVIKGPTMDSAALKARSDELRVPVVAFERGEGIYSFAGALRALWAIRSDPSHESWFRCLPPVARELTREIVRRYESYRRILVELESMA